MRKPPGDSVRELADAQENIKRVRRDGKGQAIMKIVADRGLCSGHARCAAVAPDLIELSDDGFISFSELEVPDAQLALAERAVRACPERALKLVPSDAQ